MVGAGPSDRLDSLLERDSALRRLSQALDAAQTAKGSLTIIEGAAGTGKSSLMAQVCEKARDDGLRVFSATGNELERTFPFGVAIQLFADPAHRLREPREAVTGAAELALPLLEGEVPPPSNDPMPSFPLMHGLFWLVVGLAEQMPILIAVDDAHWSDSLSLRFLAYLLARMDELPVAVALTVRSGEMPDPEAEGLLREIGASALCDTLVLDALGEDSTAEMVRRELPAADSALCAAFHEATGGNPFLLKELLAAALEEPALSSDAVKSLRPDSIRASILLRLGRLGDDARRMAVAVATLGSTATLPIAAELADLDEGAAATAIDTLVERHILTPGERPRFLHPIIGETVYADLPDAQRRHDHAAAARVLRDRGASTETVASHVLHAEPLGDDWVIAALRDAAAQAASRGDAAIAVALLRRALEEPAEDDAALLLELGRAEVAMADSTGLTHLTQARDRAREPLQRATALAGLGQALYVAGDAKGAFEAVEAALAQVPPGQGGPPEAELLGYIMSSGRLVPELVDEAVALLEQPRDIEGAATPAELARRAVRAFDFVLRGDRRRVTDELAWMAEHGADPALRRSLPTIVGAAEGLALWQLGRYRESEVLVNRMIEEAQRRANLLDLAVCLEGRVGINWGRGDVNACIADAETLLGLNEEGWETATVPTRSLLAEMRLERDDRSGAEAALAPIAAVESRLEGSHGWPWLPYARAQLAFQAGDWQESLAQFLTAGERLLTIQAPSPDYMPWRSAAARSAARLGDHDRAGELIEEALSLARSSGSRRAAGIALAAAGTTRGGDEGIELLQGAVEELEDTEAELAPARARAELGTALRLGRRPRDARIPLEEAIDAARRLGARRLAERALSELRAAGGRPRRTAMSGVESLTPSQRRVAEMAAGGMSNREIAEGLFVTRRTVETHLSQVYMKLDIDSRDALPAMLGGADADPTPMGG